MHSSFSSSSSASASATATSSIIVRKDVSTFDVLRLRPRNQKHSSPLPPPPSLSSSPPPPPSSFAIVVGVYAYHRSRDSAAKVWFVSAVVAVDGEYAASLQVKRNPNSSNLIYKEQPKTRFVVSQILDNKLEHVVASEDSVVVGGVCCCPAV